MKTEKEKMIAGEIYDSSDPQLAADRYRARGLCLEMNRLSPDDKERHQQILNELFGREVQAFVTPPFNCDYGYNITLGKNAYFNFNCVILDIAPVSIGSNTLFGPGVQIYGAMHPMLPEQRPNWMEYGKPVTIEDDVWVGGAAIICPGVTIGRGSVIGAGSVVTRDIPPMVFAAGNPCRVIRPLDESDRIPGL